MFLGQFIASGGVRRAVITLVFWLVALALFGAVIATLLSGPPALAEWCQATLLPFWCLGRRSQCPMK